MRSQYLPYLSNFCKTKNMENGKTNKAEPANKD